MSADNVTTPLTPIAGRSRAWRRALYRWWRYWLRQLGLRRLGLRRRPDSIVALDLETSSLDVASAAILSIAAVRIRHGKVQIGEALELLVAAEDHDVEAGIHIHRLRPSELRQGLPLAEALQQLRAFVGNAAILGYYIRFDLGVLNRHLLAQHLPPLRNRRLELSYAYQRRWLRHHPGTPPDLHFEAMAERLSVPILHRHTALGDATTTALMWLALQAGKKP